MSEWLINFNSLSRAADIVVHVIHISHVIITSRSYIDFQTWFARNLLSSSEWLSLMAFLGTADIRVHIVHTSHVIIKRDRQGECTKWASSLGWFQPTQGLYSLSGKTSYRKISRSLEAARFGFKLFQSLWNLARTSAALLPRCLSNFRAIRPLQHPISRLRDFTRFGGKTSYRLVNRGPGYYAQHIPIIIHTLRVLFCGCFVHTDYTHILQGCFTGTGAIIWLPQCQWTHPEGCG